MSGAAVRPMTALSSRYVRVAGVSLLRLASVAAGLAYVKVYTKLLEPEEVGAFFYLMALSYVLNALIFVPIDFYTQARVSRLESLPLRGLWHLVSRVLLLSLGACLVMSIPLLWLRKLTVTDIPALYLMAALLYLCTTARGILNNRTGPVFVCWMLLFEALARLCAFVAAAHWLTPSAQTLIYSGAAALALEFLLIVRFARRNLDLKGDIDRLDSPLFIARSAAPVAGSAICNAMQLQAYRVAYPMIGLGAVSGVYGVVSNIGAVAMAAVGSVFSQMHTPRLYRSEGRYAGTYIKLSLGLGLGMLAISLAFSGFIVRTLTQPEYADYAYAIGFGVITETGNLVAGAMTVYLMLHQAPRKLLIANVAGALVSLSGLAWAMHWKDSNPVAIGFPIAASQVIVVLMLIALAFPRRSPSGTS